jgi:hypothetical protein
MPKFFSISEGTTEIAGVTFKWPDIKPSGTAIDILNDFAWKHSLTNQAVSDVPDIFINEFSLPYGKWMQNIANVFTNVTTINRGKALDPYVSLYTGVPTGFAYRFPYIVDPGSSIKGSIKNSWEQIDLLQSAAKLPGIGGIFSAASKVVNAVEDFYGGFGYEKLQSFKSTSKRSITVKFPLYNTVNIKNTIDNFWFVTLFALQNLKVRTTFLTYIPPKIYEVQSSSLGSAYMPAAYVEDYNVYSIGATRQINIDGVYHLIPEAYKVEIKFTDLMDPSTNIEAGSAAFDKRLSVIRPSNQNPGGVINLPGNVMNLGG